MKSSVRNIFAWILGVVISSTVCALDITTEENAPFNYVDGQQVTGISTDIIVEMGHRSGIPMKIQVLPWVHAYQSALNTPDTCVYSITKRPEHENAFKWIGPISTNKWALFAKNDFNKTISNIAEARDYRIGGVTMDAKSMHLKSLGFSNIDLVGDDNLNLIKLMTGRIDLWISGLYKGNELFIQNGVKNIKPILIVREVEYYLACNPKTTPATIAALTQSLQSLKKDGYVKSVTDRYADKMTVPAIGGNMPNQAPVKGSVTVSRGESATHRWSVL